MKNRGSRRLRRRAHGPLVRPRASTRARRSLAVGTLFALGLTILWGGVAQANAPGPTGAIHMTAVVNANQTVTVNASGTWLWMYSRSDSDGGLNATVAAPCDHRSGVGWGVMWSDPQDAGFTETYTSKFQAQTVHMGSRGLNPANTDSVVAFNHAQSCGTFTQTNQPLPGDGFVTGTWTASHVYNNATAVPGAICVVTYDLGFGKMPLPKYRNFSNDDNSVAWQLQDTGHWSMSTGGVNCQNIPAATPAPPVPTPTIPPAKTVAKTTPPPTVTPRVAPTPAARPPAVTGPLAFTGFGPTGRLLTLIGMILVVVGLVFYFVDVRKAVLWLLGL
jgi:hypothetical protein